MVRRFVDFVFVVFLRGVACAVCPGARAGRFATVRRRGVAVARVVRVERAFVLARVLVPVALRATIFEKRAPAKKGKKKGK